MTESSTATVSAISFSDERWYFWKFTWGTGRAALEVREDGPNGRVIYNTSKGTGGFAYRPVPHFVYLGSPVGRGGPQDASIPGSVYKNVWLSSSPRPQFPASRFGRGSVEGKGRKPFAFCLLGLPSPRPADTMEAVPDGN